MLADVGYCKAKNKTPKQNGDIFLLQKRNKSREKTMRSGEIRDFLKKGLRGDQAGPVGPLFFSGGCPVKGMWYLFCRRISVANLAVYTGLLRNCTADIREIRIKTEENKRHERNVSKHQGELFAKQTQ